ncbi:MAG: acyl-CoA thioesterase [Spirochaetales bacterium]|nr:acyl-CoA thioesterase [Candidatus Physcosoma equi]
MEAYRHVVQYYETDKMGITHHSNYVRWMEEARVDFLSQIGWPYAKLEEEGIVSPVMEVAVKYMKSSTFSDEIFITVSVSELKMAKMRVTYAMMKKDGTPVCEASSLHAFMNQEGRPLILKRDFPDLFEKLSQYVVTETNN